MSACVDSRTADVAGERPAGQPWSPPPDAWSLTWWVVLAVIKPMGGGCCLPLTSMTIEHRLRFDLTDLAYLVAVAFECVTCGCSVAVPLAANNSPRPGGGPSVPAACVRCGTTWEQQRERSPEARFMRR